MQKKSIVFVYHNLKMGGAEKEMLAYITHLNRSKYSIHLILTQRVGEFLSILPKYVHLHIAYGDSITPSFEYLYNLYQLLHTIKPEVVVGFMQDVCFNILIVRKLGFLNFKMVISEQVVLSEWQKVKKTPWFKQLLIRHVYKEADFYFAQAESIAEDLKENFGIRSDRIILMPSFAPVQVTSKMNKKENQALSHTFFLYMGRLAPEKNIETMLYAFYELRKAFKDVYLYIVGSHETFLYDDICTELEISDSVRFVGYTHDIYTYYKGALALIIPSYVEGRSRVMIEAMTIGCPVLCSNFKGHEKYIYHKVTGLIFDKYSVSELFVLMQYAMQNPKSLQKIAINAKKYIFEKHVETNQITFRTTLNKAMERLLCELSI